MKIIIENKHNDPDSIFDVNIMAVHEKKMFIMFNNQDDMDRFIKYLHDSVDEDIREHLMHDLMIGKEYVYVGIPFHYISNGIKFLIYDNDCFIHKNETSD